MGDYIQFWLSKAIADFLIFGGVLVVVLIGIALWCLPGIIKQSRCKHSRYRETMACDAICSDCGKNLGFIGSIRDKDK
jgi:hypothetical protein